MYEERRERTIPVKTAMKRAMGTESTPRRRIWIARSGAQVDPSARARPASKLRRPTCAMKPARVAAPTGIGRGSLRKLGKVTELGFGRRGGHWAARHAAKLA